MLRSLFSRSAPVRVQPFFGFRNGERLFLNARAIRAAEPSFARQGFWGNFRTMLSQYASREVADLPVTLEYHCGENALISERVVSDAEGFVRFDLRIDPACPPPDRTRWEKAVLRWEEPGEEGKQAGTPREASAYILTPGEQTRTGIISDIDDTILETGITGNVRQIARNWKRVMTTMPSERAIVPHARDFYAAIGGDPAQDTGAAGETRGPRARVRPVFYVSSSPWNLFSYLVAFKRQRNLPLGPVMLRDWGFNRKTLGSEGHGSHKEAAIARILDMFPHLRFALIGDDSQKDMVAFGNIAAQRSGRIAAIFIRAVSGEPLSDKEIEARKRIEKADVPFWTGDDYRAATEFLLASGLELEGGVEPLVRTASEGTAEEPKDSAAA
ncbi:phosphatase domain-containing protein [Erythrobacter sp.]|jgi:phosphatidate phosphatase APP1|uniref:phosphatase domain-containing protein n=1 Tax=Erythrobacter sp. TaxID=1042 RepID=UPI002E9DB552|nr:phosphatase domain-containing protein [Erythrobacter sp.]